MELIHLISASPRRQILLKQMGLPFSVSPVVTDEFLDPALPPEILAVSIAEEKLHAYLDKKKENIKWAVAADTFIYHEGQTIGKPADRNEAKKILMSFSGKKHQVYSGVALYKSDCKEILTEIEITDVEFRHLTENEIVWYLNTGEWKEVAGAYRIQEKGECLIKGINGSYSSVMGLPITLFYGMLSKLNYEFDKFPAV